MRILIVEDETAIGLGLKFNFEQEGYEVKLAADGQTALTMFGDQEAPIDLVVLDLMLPDMSGYAICREIRQLDPYVPVIVLSARTLSQDKAQAFDVGTDQYVTKPFDLQELLSRVRNLLERRRVMPAEIVTPPPAAAEPFQFGQAEVYFRRYEVHVGENVHQLTKMEMELLRYFIENEGDVLSRAQILRDVWQESTEVTTRSIDNFVLRLRRIIERDPGEPRHILSVRGTGYRFVAQPEAASEV